MNKQLKTWAAVGLLACAAGCSKPGTVREANDAADATAIVCPNNPSRYLHIDASNFRTECFAPRGNAAGRLVRIPNSAATFETQCAVTINETQVDFKSACSPRKPTRLPIVENDEISIERDRSSGNLVLKRLRGGMVVPLTQGTVRGGGAPYLISGEINGVVYAVYLDVAGVQDNGSSKEFEKIYRIEMFDLKRATNRTACLEHLPKPDSTATACPTDIQVYSLQTGTSTGGEPPPR